MLFVLQKFYMQFHSCIHCVCTIGNFLCGTFPELSQIQTKLYTLRVSVYAWLLMCSKFLLPLHLFLDVNTLNHKF